MRLLPVVLVVAVLPLAGCGAGTMGMTGLITAADGTRSLLISWCGGEVPVGVGIDQPVAGQDLPRHVARFDAVADLPGSSAVVPLDQDVAAGTWKADPGNLPLADGVTYEVFGFNHDGTWYTEELVFRIDEVPAMTTDQVLVTRRDPETYEPNGTELVTQDAFDDTVREVCG
ncbi:hypothetical protein GCM10022223_52130 [Kineosporia mesophila]|uniref:Lipoprotein n=1 Tax=Kineosporia mesophila TaxID=566012 RepID=A0ABP7AB41_9ACTN|nr:hypothetical protein [Kineosporia mesophila]MCD5351397.1 hypothetical protein [Kineosporia mesophila]